MQTIGDFFQELRVSFVNDPRGARMNDAVLRPYFMDALKAMYSKHKAAFYGKYTEADFATLEGKTPAEFVKVRLSDILGLGYHSLLRDNTWRKTNAGNLRGQAQGAPLPAQQAASDSPTSGAV